MVRILGDASNLAKSATDVGSKFTKAASGAHAAFSSFLGTLNQTGVLGPFGDVLSKVDEGLSGLAEHGKNVSSVMLGAGSTMVAVGGLFSQLGSKEAAAHQQLDQAIQNTGGSYEKYAGQIDAAIKHNEKFGDTSVQTQEALQELTQATGSPTKALQLLGTATDLAAAKHEDLVTAASGVAKVYNGNTKLLKEFGVTATSTATITKQLTAATTQAGAADKALTSAKQKLADLETLDAQKKKLTTADAIALRNAEQNVTTASLKSQQAHQKLTATQQAMAKATSGSGTAIDQLGDKLRGQAAASSDTFSGHIKAVSTAVEDQVSVLGQKYGPTLQKTGAALAGVGTIMKTGKGIMDAFSAGQKAAATATDVEAAANDAAAPSIWATLAPILLIIAAIAILAAAVYLIWKNWKTIWADMKKIIEDVWKWIQAYWPYLAGVLLGPFGIAAALIYKNFDSIKKAAKAVIDYIVAIWNGLVAFFVGIPARLQAVAGRLFQFISDAAQTAAGIAEGIWNGVIGWMAGLPGRIAGVAAGLWNSVYSEASRVWGLVAGVWNTMIGWVSGLENRVTAAVSNMWHGITDAFRGALDNLIDLWNRLKFTIGGWHIGPVGIPKVTVGLPTIPHLAQGGLMTSSGLVFAHAGEVISPAPAAAAGRGPVVHIDNAHFATALDVDAFMDRVAWAARKKAV
jgi:hypothetical protein